MYVVCKNTHPSLAQLHRCMPSIFSSPCIKHNLIIARRKKRFFHIIIPCDNKNLIILKRLLRAFLMAFGY